MTEEMPEIPNDDSQFYGNAKKYWEGIPATVDGMLGGYGSISSTDINDSLAFIGPLLEPEGKTKRQGRALDCGAGIGRITKHLLSRLASRLDMVEVTQAFLTQAKKSYLGPVADKVENYFCSGLQDFVPEVGGYNIIWCQWVLGQLRDDHLVTFFARCKEGLAENGIIVLKENICKTENPDFDADDHSYCRGRDHLVSLIKKAGLTIVKEDRAKRFPREIYEVRSFACI